MFLLIRLFIPRFPIPPLSLYLQLKGNLPRYSITLRGPSRTRQSISGEEIFGISRWTEKRAGALPWDKELTNSWRPRGNAASTISTVLDRVDAIIWRVTGKGLDVQRTLQGVGAIYRITRDDRLFGLKRDRWPLFCGKTWMRFIVGQYNIFWCGL